MDKGKVWTLTSFTILMAIGVLVYFRVLATVWGSYDVNLRATRPHNLVGASTSAENKTILLWTSFFEDDWFLLGNSSHFNSCPKYKNCLMTRSRELLDIGKFDAILFHGNEVKRGDIPSGRSLQQKYVFVNLESPRNRPLTDYFLENYFNLTMTYRLDSDIPWPYYVVRDIDTGKVVAPLQNVEWIDPSYDPLRWKLDLRFDQKTKMAAWLVSNCETHGKREVLIQQLEKDIRIDRIGKCGHTVIPQCATSTAQCFAQIIEPQYFFYLSFENTLCQDYVTEKFLNALSHDVIPVVYGGANYSWFAPPHSYIDALDFESPKALADYLTDLSQDREEYLSYFWWKRFYTVGPSRNYTLCKLCELLNEPRPPKTYSPLSNWFAKDKCPMQNFMNGNRHASKELRNHVNKITSVL